MATLRTLRQTVLATEQREGVGAVVRRSIGNSSFRNLDPFLLLDEFSSTAPAGFPDHPHRGFETVTYLLGGAFEHEDFAGHRGKLGKGDLQWMTAGRGIVHSEMPLGKGPNVGLQLWVNLPAKDKMCEPRFHIEHSDVTYKIMMTVIAGECMGVKAKVYTMSPIYYLDVTMEANAEFTQPIPFNQTCFIYTLKGLVEIDGKPVDAHTTAVFEENGDIVVVKTRDASANFVLIAGKRIGEPIARHGPFVMNTAEEIDDAIRDYQTGLNGFERAAGWKSEIGARK